ncbi:TRAP transporter small permease [Roseomonas sp. SSH11]|uniref:TRAP transporter small permease protein n=1 Tax=Pararoseomonas baculiformis TaxID=2820812 RepID=A0ABS4ABF5_9PROT|nr:TRAP transporter small permease [Pararoseomonas baculiformis]MBP0444336.1 TRAP transporter small permease [Pararoseomonas baculiformis]
MNAVSRLFDLLCRIVIVVAGAALIFLVAITGWMVFGRYVLNDTPTWVERAAVLIVLAISLPVAAVGVRERFHLSVVGFREALPRRVQRWVMVGCDAAVGLFGIAMAYYSQELVETAWAIRIPLIGVSQAWTYMPLIIGGILIALFAAEQVLRDITGANQPEATIVTLE